jgi:hypothetical protein
VPVDADEIEALMQDARADHDANHDTRVARTSPA